MDPFTFIVRYLLVAMAIVASTATTQAAEKRPDIVFIIVVIFVSLGYLALK